MCHIKECEWCNKKFVTCKNKQRFCCSTCRNASQNLRHRRESAGMKICQNCGKEFYYDGLHRSLYKDSKQKTGVRADKYCCYACGRAKALERVKKTSIEKYGAPCSLNNPAIREKAKKTLTEHYGTDVTFKSKEIREKAAITNLEKYGATNVLSKNSPIRKQVNKKNIEKYGYANPAQNREIINKITDAKRKRHTFNSSQEEKVIKELLEKKFKEVKYQYKSEKYPFACDFYIVDLDLYLEYQGYWTHGEEPFDENNQKHLNYLNKRKEAGERQYKSLYYAWVIRDPLKRKIAKDNNLNWIEFFNFKQFEEWYNRI